MSNQGESPLKHLCVVTSGRQDWSILRPVCLALQKHGQFKVTLLACGMACDPQHGNLAVHLADEGMDHVVTCDWREDLDPQADINEESAAIYRALPRVLQSIAPDALMLLGDRYETLHIASIAIMNHIPLIHLHGGEESEGALDNLFRHAISKMSHLHFVSHPLHRQRLLQMGEAPEAVVCVGAPGLDNLRRTDLLSREALAQKVGMPLPSPLVLVTLHPTTLLGAQADSDTCEAMLAAMAQVDASYLITLPNSDPGNAALRSRLSEFAANHPHAVAVNALGAQGYASALKLADAMLGNSSSALIEAPFFAVPAINIGERQKGRLKLSNVRDVAATPDAIRQGLLWALESNTKAALKNDCHVLGDGHSAEKIVAHLSRWACPAQLQKPFHLLQGH